MARGNKDPFFSVERAGVEFSRKAVAGQSEGILGSISCKNDSRSISVENEGVVMEVSRSIVVVWNLDTLDKLQDFVKVDVFGLLNDCNVEGGCKTVACRLLGKAKGCAERDKR